MAERVGLSARATRRRALPYGRRAIGSATALLYLAGGLTILLVVVLPHPAVVNVPVLLVLGVTAPVLAAVIFLRRDRLPLWTHHWFSAAGSVIATILVAAGGGGTTSVAFSFLYIWSVVYAMLFFSPRMRVVHIALAAGTCGSVLLWLGPFQAGSYTAVEPVVLVAVIGTTAGIVHVLSRARETSEVDPLTQVANRRGFERILDQAMAQALLDRQPLVLAMIDVDNFKQINDERGHHAGDTVLQELADRWRATLRAGDTIARFGGDEFVVVLPACPPGEMTALLERLRSAAPAGVTCSVGAAQWCPGDSATMALLGADSALYEAKRLGRDRVVAGVRPLPVTVIAVDLPVGLPAAEAAAAAV